jgi:hypothetical protein
LQKSVIESLIGDHKIEGKSVGSLRVYEDPSEDCEVIIEFTHGTTFSCAMDQRVSAASTSTI